MRFLFFWVVSGWVAAPVLGAGSRRYTYRKTSERMTQRKTGMTGSSSKMILFLAALGCAGISSLPKLAEWHLSSRPGLGWVGSKRVVPVVF